MTLTPQDNINSLLAKVTGAVVGQFELSRLLQQVVAMSMETLHAEVCSIFLAEMDSGRLVLKMKAGSGFATPLVGKATYEMGQGFTGYVAQHDQVFNIKSPDELHSLRVDGRPIWQGRYDDIQFSGANIFRNMVAVPLRVKEQIVGVMKIENKDETYGPFFSEQDEQYCVTIANVVALAIENARLHQHIEGESQEMAAMAAHRIKSQLIGFDAIELELQAEANEPVPDRQHLNELVKRMTGTKLSVRRLVHELIRYGKPLQLDKQACDIRKVIDDEKWLIHAPQRIAILHDADPDLPTCIIDPIQIAESIKQLLSNAVRAVLSLPGGAGTIQIRTTREEGSIVLRIADDGPGFPPGFPLFKPYETTEKHGTGLGLVTVKKVVTAHGGTITACNIAPRGAGVEIRLPLNG